MGGAHRSLLGCAAGSVRGAEEVQIGLARRTGVNNGRKVASEIEGGGKVAEVKRRCEGYLQGDLGLAAEFSIRPGNSIENHLTSAGNAVENRSSLRHRLRESPY